MYKGLRITIVIPCLNEEKGIGEVLSRMPAFVDEVVVVDNGSEDRTAGLAAESITEVVYGPKRGYGGVR